MTAGGAAARAGRAPGAARAHVTAGGGRARPAAQPRSQLCACSRCSRVRRARGCAASAGPAARHGNAQERVRGCCTRARLRRRGRCANAVFMRSAEVRCVKKRRCAVAHREVASLAAQREGCSVFMQRLAKRRWRFCAAVRVQRRQVWRRPGRGGASDAH